MVHGFVSGIYAAPVTPRRASGHEIDLAAMLEFVDYLGESGVDGIALLCPAGEFVHFNPEERVRVTALATKRSRLPVLANCSHSTLDGAVFIAQEISGAGVAGLLLMPPYFFRYEQPEIERFYLEFMDLCGASPPVYLSNVPSFTSEIAPSTAARLLATGRFAGIHDVSRHWGAFDSGAGFPRVAGCDATYAGARSKGAAGAISETACVVPELMVALDRAIEAGAPDAIARLEARLNELLAWIDSFPSPVGIREAAAARGLKAGPPAVPLGPENVQRAAEFRAWFQAWLPAVQKECKDV